MRAFRQAQATTEPPATKPSNAPVINVAVFTAEAIKMPMDNPLCMSSETGFDDPDGCRPRKARQARRPLRQPGLFKRYRGLGFRNLTIIAFNAHLESGYAILNSWPRPIQK